MIPLLGVGDKLEDINFKNLPNEFVLKTNNASGSNIIVKDKATFNMFKGRLFFDFWLSLNYSYTGGFQMQYEKILPKVIAEAYIQDSNGELMDYKFLCFNGKAHYCWVDVDRFGDHKRNVYDMQWKLQSWTQNDYANTEEPIDKPENFNVMVVLAEKLSSSFSQVRVDLYNVDGEIYFGEMTFTNGNGFEIIRPESMDLELGSYWNIQKERKE